MYSVLHTVTNWSLCIKIQTEGKRTVPAVWLFTYCYYSSNVYFENNCNTNPLGLPHSLKFRNSMIFIVFRKINRFGLIKCQDVHTIKILINCMKSQLRVIILFQQNLVRTSLINTYPLICWWRNRFYCKTVVILISHMIRKACHLITERTVEEIYTIMKHKMNILMNAWISIPRNVCVCIIQ